MNIQLTPEEQDEIRAVLLRASGPTGLPGAGLDWTTLLPIIMKIIAAIIAALVPPNPNPPGQT